MTSLRKKLELSPTETSVLILDNTLNYKGIEGLLYN